MLHATDRKVQLCTLSAAVRGIPLAQFAAAQYSIDKSGIHPEFHRSASLLHPLGLGPHPYPPLTLDAWCSALATPSFSLFLLHLLFPLSPRLPAPPNLLLRLLGRVGDQSGRWGGVWWWWGLEAVNPTRRQPCRQAGGRKHEEGLGVAVEEREGSGWWEPTLAEEHPSLQTCRLRATMAVTMTLEEEFPLPLLPPTPTPHLLPHHHHHYTHMHSHLPIPSS